MNKSSKILSIIALVAAVVGITIGFAAFSNTLTISSQANVTPDKSTFNVDFSSSGTAQATNPVTASGTNGATGANATISNPAATAGTAGTASISGLNANFTQPGQTVTYSFWAHNVGQYDAYLTGVAFNNVTGESSNKKCTAVGSGVTTSLLNAACNAISISVSVKGKSYTPTSTTADSHSLAVGAYEPVVVTITYASGSARADGDFTVAFGDIALTYSSVG